jgi:chromosome segregation ATPase
VIKTKMTMTEDIIKPGNVTREILKACVDIASTGRLVTVDAVIRERKSGSKSTIGPIVKLFNQHKELLSGEAPPAIVLFLMNQLNNACSDLKDQFSAALDTLESDYRDRSQNLNKQLANRSVELTDLLNDKKLAQIQLDRAQDENSKCHGEILQLTKQLRDANQLVSNKDDKLSEHQRDIRKHEKIYNDNKVKIENLVIENAGLQKTLEHVENRLIENNEETKKLIVNHNTEIKKLNKTNLELERQIASLNERHLIHEATQEQLVSNINAEALAQKNKSESEISALKEGKALLEKQNQWLLRILRTSQSLLSDGKNDQAIAHLAAALDNTLTTK